MLGFELGQFLEHLVGPGAGQFLGLVPPQFGGGDVPPGQDLVHQADRPELPGLPLVSVLQPDELEQLIQVLAVIGLRGCGIVVAIVIVVFDQRVQNDVQEANGVLCGHCALSSERRTRAVSSSFSSR